MRRPKAGEWHSRTARRAQGRPGRSVAPTNRPSRFGLPHLRQVRAQPVAGRLSVAIGKFRKVRFPGEIAGAGDAGDEVIGGLHTTTGFGEFVAQMLRGFRSGILGATADEASVRLLDE